MDEPPVVYFAPLSLVSRCAPRRMRRWFEYARQACDSSQIVTRRKTGWPSSRAERFRSSLAQYPKKFMPLDFEFDAYLETPKLKKTQFQSFDSFRNAVYVWANSAPVAQPDRATD